MKQAFNLKESNKVVFMRIFAITICLVVWMLNAVFIAFLLYNEIFDSISMEGDWLIWLV